MFIMPSDGVSNGQSAPQEGARRERVGQENLAEGLQLTVKQPERVRSLLLVLSSLEKITERVSEDRSHDLGASGASAAAGAGDQGTAGQVSLRQQAIQALPPHPIMKRRLLRHLSHEIRNLERDAARVARSVRTGNAYLLTQLYARIRKIQALMTDLLNAAVDVIQRLYIRLFIDHQQLI